jgi:5'-nucleotidase
MSEPHVLLTNDDGIDAPGLAALYEELTATATVTVVAPTDNRSGTGRTRSHRTTREDHPWGYAIQGTPADCVAYGLRGLDIDVDLLVSGCNHGPNAGNYVVGRSGTVGACIEAAFLGTPAIAISAYHAVDFFLTPPEDYDFGRPARITRELVDRAMAASLFDEADVLNVNAPVDVSEPRMRLTEPYDDYDLSVEHDVESVDDHDIALRDVTWPNTEGWENPFPADDELRERYPVGSDRRALIEGEVSLTPLTAPATAVESAAVAGVVEGFNGSEVDGA